MAETAPSLSRWSDSEEGPGPIPAQSPETKPAAKRTARLELQERRRAAETARRERLQRIRMEKAAADASKRERVEKRRAEDAAMRELLQKRLAEEAAERKRIRKLREAEAARARIEQRLVREIEQPLWAAALGLTPNEERVVRLRLLTNPPLTLGAASKRLRFTKERVAKIEREAKEKLERMGVENLSGSSLSTLEATAARSPLKPG